MFEDAITPGEPGTSADAEELTRAQVYKAYVEGSDIRPKPKMVEKMARTGLRMSWFALFLGPLYYLYRKQWKVGWIFFAVNIVATTVVDLMVGTKVLASLGSVQGTGETPLTMGYLCAALVVGLVMGFAFYPLYERSAMQAYEQWKSDSSPAKNAIGYIEQKGGISWGPVIAGIVINFLTTAIVDASLPSGQSVSVVSRTVNERSVFDDPYAGSTTLQELELSGAEGNTVIFTDPETGKTYTVENDGIQNVSNIDSNAFYDEEEGLLMYSETDVGTSSGDDIAGTSGGE